jgi:hypothetical protein
MQPLPTFHPARLAVRRLCLLALPCALVTPANAEGGRRVALVIGNPISADLSCVTLRPRPVMSIRRCFS